MWRLARLSDDIEIVALCLALNHDDPGPVPVSKDQVFRTLATFRRQPERGKTFVAEVSGAVIGYAFVVSFWSNELGGEVCVVDELYVGERHRSSGFGAEFVGQLERLWGDPLVAATLETSHTNHRAQAFFERLGFEAGNLTMVKHFGGHGASHLLDDLAHEA